MKSSNMTRSKGQVFSVGNYLMTGKILGKGHFASVEEATHRIIGKKVAIKVIDLTSIKEEYARRNLHREPRVMAKLRHPCIAALYETMMHGPRLFLVMEAAGGGDLCAHVLAARGTRGGRSAGGLPEARARPLAAQLVSAVQHMHARGVVHRDLKMENIMLDTTKQYIKIVDFGLSNLWCAGGALRTPCGSLEYAAPELFLDGRRYGPEVDLWSIGVIVYGMVTGGLPFTGNGSEGASRPHLRAAIARGFTRKQRVALACFSTDCKAFIQHLLEANVELRMTIEEAARHRWVKRPGMRMKTHPFVTLEPKVNKEIYRQISELCSETIMDIAAQVKAEPFGPMAGMYNIKSHIHQLRSDTGTDLLWTPVLQECQPQSPPEYRPMKEVQRADTSKTVQTNQQRNLLNRSQTQNKQVNGTPQKSNGVLKRNVILNSPKTVNTASQVVPSLIKAQTIQANHHIAEVAKKTEVLVRDRAVQSPRFSLINRPFSSLNKPIYKVYDNGDCGLDPRLPSIDEHSNAEFHEVRKNMRNNNMRMQFTGKVGMEERPTRLNSCPNGIGDVKRSEFYRRAGDGLPSWRASGAMATSPPKILFQSHATTIKRASMGNIVSPHSSSNSHCKSERAMPVGWYSTRSIAPKETHLQRFRKTAPMK